MLHILPDGVEVLPSTGEVIGKQQISLLMCTICTCTYVVYMWSLAGVGVCCQLITCALFIKS